MKNLVAKTVDTYGLATGYLHAHNLSNRFGHKVRLSAFGNYLIVGAPGTIATINSSSAYDPHTSTTAYSGTAYTNQRQIGNVRCFTNDTSTWASGTTQYGQSILGKAGTAVGDNNQPAFGTSCDISTNGNKISVSSPYKKVSTLGDAGQIDTYLINDDLDTWLSVSTSIAGSKSSQKLGMNLRLDFAGERLATGDLSTSNQESAYYGGISLYALDFGTDRWYDITPPIQVHNWPTVGSIDLDLVDQNNNILDDLKQNKFEIIYLLNQDNLDFVKKDEFIIYQGSHGDKGAEIADIILPGAAYTEQSGHFTNLEGRIQKAFKASYPPGDSKEDWQIINEIAETMNNRKLFNDKDELESSMFNYLSLKKEKQKETLKTNIETNEFINEDLKVEFKDYYFSNVIARASKTMLDCNNSKIDVKRTGTEG